MSKQLKYRFKKTLKKADFVHADLEYHKELIPEAKQMFQAEVDKFISGLSDEQCEELKRIAEHKQKMFEESILKTINKKKKLEELKDAEETENDGDTSLVPTDLEPDESSPEEKSEKTKAIELKRLFHKIAEHTHPDKVGVSGVSEKEAARLEKLFKKALDAYSNQNWYTLYSIALQLDIDVGDIDLEHIEWVEDDIRSTLGSITEISRLIAWIWYVGGEQEKQFALMDYFQQMYGIKLL